MYTYNYTELVLSASSPIIASSHTPIQKKEKGKISCKWKFWLSVRLLLVINWQTKAEVADLIATLLL